MPRKIIESIEDALDRRRFLGKVTSAATALLFGVLGMPKESLGNNGECKHMQKECCCLCKFPSPVQCSGCVCPTLWVWFCCRDNPPGRRVYMQGMLFRDSV